MNLWQRECRLLWRHGVSFVQGAAFLCAYTLALVFTQDMQHNTLQTAAAGLLYAGVMLSALLSVDGLWREEWRSQALLPLLAHCSASSVVLVKAVAHAIGTVLPLSLLALPLALLLNLPAEHTVHLWLALCLGAPALCLLCNMLAAAGLRGLFVSIIALPLLVPLFVFGGAAASGYSSEDTRHQAYLFLAAFDCVAIALCPWVGGRLLRENV